MNSPSSKYLYGRTSTFGTPLAMTKTEEDALMKSLDPGLLRTTGTRLRAAARKLRLMPHEERRKLIEAPFVARVHTHSQAWGGTYIRDSVPVDGRRVWKQTPEDEEWCRMKWEEK